MATLADFSKYREHKKNWGEYAPVTSNGEHALIANKYSILQRELKYVLPEFLPIPRYFSFQFLLEIVFKLYGSQAESENNFVASYMMEVEDDNVYIGRMITDLSGDSGLED